jgi:hypothetical protein
MAVQIFGEPALPAGTTARFRVYRANGPLPPPPSAQVPPPGDLLYQSTDVPIIPGVQAVRLANLAVDVPGKVIWTVEFNGAGTVTGERAGPQVYHPPIVGSSFKDYWVHEPTRWRLYLLPTGPASFAATFEADPDPPVVVTGDTPIQGQPVLNITGPVGSEQIIEASTDLQQWQAVGLADLTRTNRTVFVDEFANPAVGRQYRTRPAGEPGLTGLIRGLRPLATGGQTVHVSGSPRTEHVVEMSENLGSWTSVGTVTFTSSNATLDDATAPAEGYRFYRMRLLPKE